MTDRVAAIVDAVRLRVEDELRQQLQSLETEHQRRVDEQQRAAEAAARASDEQWTARVQTLESQAQQRLASALAAARDDFDRRETDGRTQAASRSARLILFHGELDRCRSLSDALDLLVREVGADAALLLYRQGDWQPWAPTGVTTSPLAGGWTLMAERVREAGMTVIQDGLHAVPLTIDKKTVGAVIKPSSGPDDDQIDLSVYAAAARLTALTATRLTEAASWLYPGSDPSATQVAWSDPVEADADPDGSARRYARLLVSEVKLYNEPAVREGRANRDLSRRLATEIARARQSYDESRGAAAATTDHFQDALVQILADGDPALLA